MWGFGDESSGGFSINENITLQEGEHVSWRFTLYQKCPIRLHVRHNDGAYVNVLVMSDEEYQNYTQGLNVLLYPDLSSECVYSDFENTASLQAGSYVLVVELPTMHDGEDSYAVAGVRCEALE